MAEDHLYSHESEAHPLSEVMRQINRSHLVIARQVKPPPDADVEAHQSYWSIVLGVSRSEVVKYMEIGYMLERFPRLAQLCEERGILPLSHLAVLGRHTRPVAEPSVVKVEEGLLAVVKPGSDGEALRGARWLATRVQRVLHEHAPEACPRDVEIDGPEADRALLDQVESAVDQANEEGVAEKEADEVCDAAFDYFGDRATVRESITIEDRDPLGPTVITAVLERHHAVEVKAIIDAAARELNVSRAQGFLAVMRGTCRPEVTLDLFRVLTPDENGESAETPVWLSGAGWLSPLAAESWMRRVTALRVLGDSEVEGYAPSDSQRSFVQGRDGVCSFPGCDVPAEKCDIDHIVEFDAGGPTSTDNLHCLCRKHHNLKTAGIVRVVRRDDGVEEWTILSRDEGSFAQSDKAHTGYGRYTFESQTVKRAQALAEHNRKLKELKEKLERLIDKSRAEREEESGDEQDDEPPF